MPEIPVNPDVLKWAREVSGLSRPDAAGRLRIPEIDLVAYEEGTKTPLLGVLRLMAQKYPINQVSLFLPQRPKPTKKITQYRAAVGGRPVALSNETLTAIQEVQDALEAFAEVRSSDPELFPLPALDRVRSNETPDELARRQRSRFGLSIDFSKGLRSQAHARDYWRSLIEAQGVFVYLLEMNLDDCRGFSLIHQGIPAICVNDLEENAGAECFTLWHEYCHLLRRQTGVSDENQHNRVERYCNQFAASFLVPLVPLRQALNSPRNPIEYTRNTVQALAGKFRVSQKAMALRLEESHLAPEGYYERHFAHLDRPRPRKDVAKQKEFRSPSAVDVAERALGRRHTLTVLKALRRGALDPVDARGLLRVPVGKIGALEARFE